MKKRFVLFLVLQGVAWALFTVCDAFDERNNREMIIIPFLGVPILFIIMYFTLRSKLYQSEMTVVKLLQLCGLWIANAAVLGYVITEMTCKYNCYLVYQENEGWFDMLNGIEYPMYGIAIGAIPVLAALVGEGVIALVKRVRAQ